MSERGEHDIDNGRSVSAPVAWLTSPGLVFGGVVAILLAGGALVAGQPALALAATPIILSIAWSWQRRRAPADIRVDAVLTRTDKPSDLDYRVALDPPPGTDAVSVRVLLQGAETRHTVVTTDTARSLAGTLTAWHSGPQELLRVDYSLIGSSGGQLTVPAEGPRINRVISPQTLPLRRLPLPFRMVGLAGNHGSIRPGEGGEFRDIGQFRPGDRLRRIDWKVTARRAQAPGDLYVRHSYATADATVLIVLDSRDNVSQLITPWRLSASKTLDGETSLDLAREAASSLASAYVRAGDRVGFRDLASRSRMIAPGGGINHLHRLLPAIARAEPIGSPQRRVRAPIIPSGAMVYIVSTFLDDEAAALASVWRASGHRVVAVDALSPILRGSLTLEERAALGIVTLEREARLNALEAEGVDVIAWLERDGLVPESQLAVRARPARYQR